MKIVNFHQKRKEKKKNDTLPPDPRITDGMFAALDQIIQQQNFETEKELEEFIAELMEKGALPLMPVPDETPKQQALNLVYQAFNETGRQRELLARQALEIDSNCTDAYSLLAEECSDDPQKAIQYYEKAIAAWEGTYSKSFIKEIKGNFWLVHETRPYMRALMGLALNRWALGYSYKAISILKEMLVLSKGDNLGARYYLVPWLIIEHCFDEAEKILKKFSEEDTFFWLMNSALIKYAKNGSCAAAEKLLRRAIEENQFAASYILIKRRMPDEIPNYIRRGDDSEAIDYCWFGIESWNEVDGAVDWLRSIVE